MLLNLGIDNSIDIVDILLFAYVSQDIRVVS